MFQSEIQPMARSIKDRKRAPLTKERRNIPTPVDLASTTYIETSPKAPAPRLGPARTASAQLFTPPRVRPESPFLTGKEGEAKEKQRRGSVYVRHFGIQPNGQPCRNWSNEECGIFPGSGHRSQLGLFTKDRAVEYKSRATMQRDKNANYRSPVALPQKYTKPVTASQEIGWDLALAEWHDHQHFPRMRCHLTKADQDLNKNNVREHMILRRYGMKC